MELIKFPVPDTCPNPKMLSLEEINFLLAIWRQSMSAFCSNRPAWPHLYFHLIIDGQTENNNANLIAKVSSEFTNCFEYHSDIPAATARAINDFLRVNPRPTLKSGYSSLEVAARNDYFFVWRLTLEATFGRFLISLGANDLSCWKTLPVLARSLSQLRQRDLILQDSVDWVLHDQRSIVRAISAATEIGAFVHDIFFNYGDAALPEKNNWKEWCDHQTRAGQLPLFFQ